MPNKVWGLKNVPTCGELLKRGLVENSDDNSKYFRSSAMAKIRTRLPFNDRKLKGKNFSECAHILEVPLWAIRQYFKLHKSLIRHYGIKVGKKPKRLISAK